MDLTKITKPFGLLDPETQEALKAHGGPYERYSCEKGEGFFDCPAPVWYHYVVYRVKPQLLTKPSIDWSHVAPKWRWLARDEDGAVYLFEEKPELCKDSWLDTQDCTSARSHVSYTPGTCDWQDSLVERPE